MNYRDLGIICRLARYVLVLEQLTMLARYRLCDERGQGQSVTPSNHTTPVGLEKSLQSTAASYLLYVHPLFSQHSCSLVELKFSTPGRTYDQMAITYQPSVMKPLMRSITLKHQEQYLRLSTLPVHTSTYNWLTRATSKATQTHQFVFRRFALVARYPLMHAPCGVESTTQPQSSWGWSATLRDGVFASTCKPRGLLQVQNASRNKTSGDAAGRASAVSESLRTIFHPHCPCL